MKGVGGVNEQTIMSPIHPGEALHTEFLEPLNITPYRLAHDIGVTATRVSELLHGKRRVTADTALRLGRYFGTSPQFWLNLQSHYDLEVRLEQVAETIERIVPVSTAG